jgi:predicted short-subunit dehydrogenase-like oxidoreductase (DUF2520 family)
MTPVRDATVGLDPLYVVGGGRIGSAVALLARRAGVPLAGIWCRGRDGAARASELVGIEAAHGPMPEAIAGAGLLLLAVPEDAVGAVAGALLDGGLLRGARAVLHVGGSRPASEALENLVGSTPSLGTFHPILAAAEARRVAELLPRSSVGIEGDAVARVAARALAVAIGAAPLELPAGQMALYHAAAVLVGNFPVALLAAALDLLGGIGIEEEPSKKALVGLLGSVVANLDALGPRRALTGPVRRGDARTVARHLEALSAASPALVPAYVCLTRLLLGLARGSSPPPPESGLAEIAAILEANEGPGG